MISFDHSDTISNLLQQRKFYGTMDFFECTKCGWIFYSNQWGLKLSTWEKLLTADELLGLGYVTTDKHVCPTSDSYLLRNP